jgi:hypothetical protein
LNPESIRVLRSLPVHLSSILLNNFGIDIFPINSELNVDCTLLEVDCELVTLVAIIFRVYTQGEGEGESLLYLGQTLVKLTRGPWRVT